MSSLHHCDFVSIETVVISPGDPILFGWWCVEQGAHLYGWSEDGREQEERDLVSHWEIVHHLLPLTFKPVSQRGREELERCGVFHCRELKKHN